LKGERRPEESLAAHPKAFFGCSSSSCVAISIVYVSDDSKTSTYYVANVL
jgi:hypothetical protein